MNDKPKPEQAQVPGEAAVEAQKKRPIKAGTTVVEMP
jgi:hypothetical protein